MCSRPGIASRDVEFRVGDVLTVACPFTEARVEGNKWGHVSVRWPWWRVDPDSEFHHWNGIVALSADTTPGPRTEPELLRTDPAPEFRAPGDVRRVGIPPTTAYVTAVDHFDPPQETGWLPRPTPAVSVLPRGMSYREYPDVTHLNGIGYELHPTTTSPSPSISSSARTPSSSRETRWPTPPAAHGGSTARGTGTPSTTGPSAASLGGRRPC